MLNEGQEDSRQDSQRSNGNLAERLSSSFDWMPHMHPTSSIFQPCYSDTIHFTAGVVMVS